MTLDFGGSRSIPHGWSLVCGLLPARSDEGNGVAARQRSIQTERAVSTLFAVGGSKENARLHVARGLGRHSFLAFQGGMKQHQRSLVGNRCVLQVHGGINVQGAVATLLLLGYCGVSA